jgi:hypothetical protein
MDCEQESPSATKTEPEIAVRLIILLDGLSISEAQAALARASELLGSTQIVSKKNLLLT